MSNLLIFFALPLATIIIAIVLERVWNNYILVTLFTFAIYLIVAFAMGNASLLTLVIAYTFLALISAFLSMLFRKLSKRLENIEEAIEEENERNRRQRQTENSNNRPNCNCNRNNAQNVAINASFTPNRANNGRTGSLRGQYRRLI